MTPTHPHPTPPPAADTVAPVTVTPTYRERVEALGGIDQFRPAYRAGFNSAVMRAAAIAAEADARIAELERDLERAVRQYLAWAPSPDAGTGDGGG